AYPHGPTCASNLKALCRFHHLLKTFWGGPHGWRDRQQPDGDVVWTSPSGQTYTTRPGSRLLFPSLCLPTAPITVTDTPTAHTAGLTMPRRTTTRAHDRRQRINDERQHNHTDNHATALDAIPPF
ncbi:HNH endonuclease, partial [Mycolicibacterium sp. P9-64]